MPIKINRSYQTPTSYQIFSGSNKTVCYASEIFQTVIVLAVDSNWTFHNIVNGNQNFITIVIKKYVVLKFHFLSKAIYFNIYLNRYNILLVDRKKVSSYATRLSVCLYIRMTLQKKLSESSRRVTEHQNKRDQTYLSLHPTSDHFHRS